MLTALACLILGAPATDLTFVRHGETLANATGKYSESTLNTFSNLGEQQVNKLTQTLLKSKPYDIILVSSSPRAMKTIAPYLAASKQKALIWPLLYECCTGKRPASAHATKFTWAGQVSLNGQSSKQFAIDPTENRLPNSPDYNSGLAQVDACIKEFNRKYLGKRVLVVGHAAHGGQFLFQLTGRHIQVKNAVPIHETIRILSRRR